MTVHKMNLETQEVSEKPCLETPSFQYAFGFIQGYFKDPSIFVRVESGHVEFGQVFSDAFYKLGEIRGL